MRGARIEEALDRAQAMERESSSSAFDPLPLLLARRLKHAAADVEFIDDFRRAYEQWRGRRFDSRTSPAAAAPRGSATPRARG